MLDRKKESARQRQIKTKKERHMGKHIERKTVLDRGTKKDRERENVKTKKEC